MPGSGKNTNVHQPVHTLVATFVITRVFIHYAAQIIVGASLGGASVLLMVITVLLTYCVLIHQRKRKEVHYIRMMFSLCTTCVCIISRDVIRHLEL